MTRRKILYKQVCILKNIVVGDFDKLNQNDSAELLDNFYLLQPLVSSEAVNIANIKKNHFLSLPLKSVKVLSHQNIFNFTFLDFKMFKEYLNVQFMNSNLRKLLTNNFNNNYKRVLYKEYVNSLYNGMLTFYFEEPLIYKILKFFKKIDKLEDFTILCSKPRLDFGKPHLQHINKKFFIDKIRFLKKFVSLSDLITKSDLLITPIDFMYKGLMHKTTYS